MIFPSFKARSTQLERLDRHDYTAEEFELWKTEMGTIHAIGGERRAIEKHLLQKISLAPGATILDIGAGSGQILAAIRSIRPDIVLIGAELDQTSAQGIRDGGFNAIRCSGIELPLADAAVDVAICSLVLHHLSDSDAVKLLREMKRVSRQGIVAVDLHRSRVAYYGFKAISIPLFQPFTREDGALSILRSFRPDELLSLGRRSGLKDARVDRSALYRLVLTGR